MFSPLVKIPRDIEIPHNIKVPCDIEIPRDIEIDRLNRGILPRKQSRKIRIMEYLIHEIGSTNTVVNSRANYERHKNWLDVVENGTQITWIIFLLICSLDIQIQYAMMNYKVEVGGGVIKIFVLKGCYVL